MVRNGKKVAQENEYLTDAQSREAVAFIQKNKDRPFFLYLSFNAIHAKLEATPESLQRIPADHKRRIIAGAMASMDEGVGKVLSALRDLGLEDNTLIIFASDNGGKAQSNNFNGCLFRGIKGDLFEGGVRVPFIVQWRGALPAGKTHDGNVCHTDIFATALGAAAVKIPDPDSREGVNLLLYICGEANGSPHEFLFWADCSTSLPASWAVRHHDWKLWSDGNGQLELFNLRQDSGEAKNLAEQRSELVRSLSVAMESWKLTGSLTKK